MLNEIKNLIYLLIIFLFLFLIGKYYFSDTNKKNSYRSLSLINENINIFVEKLPVLEIYIDYLFESIRNIKDIVLNFFSNY